MKKKKPPLSSLTKDEYGVWKPGLEEQTKNYVAQEIAARLKQRADGEKEEKPMSEGERYFEDKQPYPDMP